MSTKNLNHILLRKYSSIHQLVSLFLIRGSEDENKVTRSEQYPAQLLALCPCKITFSRLAGEKIGKELGYRIFNENIGEQNN